jgi:hypothetical protein
MKIIFCLALFLSGGLFGCSTTESSRQYIVSNGGSLDQKYILFYTKPSPASLRQIKIERISLTKEQLQKLNARPTSKTDNGVRWLVEERPDTMQNGPWNTQLYIFNTVDIDHCVRVDVIDHVRGGVEHTWLNDKMLFVKIWFGRIAWTDFVLNAETGRFDYIEDGRLDTALAPQQK